MTYLKKEDIFFERDENGNLLPLDAILETLPDKPIIKAIPLNKGELAKIVSQANAKGKDGETDVDTDIDIIINNCKEPSFSEDDRTLLKSAGKAVFTNAIALAIFSISTGVSQDEIVKAGKKKIAEKELNNFQ